MPPWERGRHPASRIEFWFWAPGTKGGGWSFIQVGSMHSNHGQHIRLQKYALQFESVFASFVRSITNTGRWRSTNFVLAYELWRRRMLLVVCFKLLSKSIETRCSLLEQSIQPRQSLTLRDRLPLRFASPFPLHCLLSLHQKKNLEIWSFRASAATFEQSRFS